MAMHPSAEGAAFILLDCVCFVDPSGAADAGIHAVKVGIEAIKVAKAIDKGKDVISAAKDAYKVADKIGDIKKATGSYEILYESGKNYVGKGGFNRAITSAKKARKVEGEVDEVVSISWKKSANSRQAFIDELDRMKVNGVNNPSTYNKIWSPGRRYTGAVEW